MKGLVFGFFRALRPAMLIKGLVVKKKPKRSELEEKQVKYVRNFAPTHYSWRQKLGKDKKKSKRDRKTSPKKPNI